jgi:hypothetical protein
VSYLVLACSRTTSTGSLETGSGPKRSDVIRRQRNILNNNLMIVKLLLLLRGNLRVGGRIQLERKILNYDLKI